MNTPRVGDAVRRIVDGRIGRVYEFHGEYITVQFPNGGAEPVYRDIGTDRVTVVGEFAEAMEYCTNIAVAIDDIYAWRNRELPDGAMQDELTALGNAYLAVFRAIDARRSIHEAAQRRADLGERWTVIAGDLL